MSLVRLTPVCRELHYNPDLKSMKGPLMHVNGGNGRVVNGNDGGKEQF